MFFFYFFGADFVAPKSGHRREKQPVLGPGYNIVDKQPYVTNLHY